MDGLPPNSVADYGSVPVNKNCPVSKLDGLTLTENNHIGFPMKPVPPQRSLSSELRHSRQICSQIFTWILILFSLATQIGHLGVNLGKLPGGFNIRGEGSKIYVSNLSLEERSVDNE